MIKFDKTSKFITLLQKNNIFLLYVYLAIITQIFVTYLTIYFYRNNIYLSYISKLSFIIYLAISSVLIISISFFNFPMWFKFLLFIIYAILYGAMLHNISFIIPKDIIDQFLIGILISFILYIIFFYIILYYDIDIDFAGFILLGFIVGLISSLIIKLNYDIFFKNKNIDDVNHIRLLYIIIILFSIYFCYSTNVIMRIEYNGDFITAAVDLYLGFLNTIIYIAELDNIKIPKILNTYKS